MRSTKRRDERIRQMLNDGIPTGAVAAKFGISSTRVGQIRRGLVGGRVVKSVEAPSPTPKPNAHSHEAQAEAQIAYIYGRVEAQLEVYASHAGIPFPELAGRLSRLLRDKAVGKVLGAHDRVPSVRRTRP